MIRIEARYHIKDSNTRSDLECSICFQTNFQFLHCEGPCLKQICRECARRRSYQECYYCGESLTVTYYPPKKVQFICPAECTAELWSEREFQEHCRGCEKMLEEIKEQFIFKSEYKCEKGHRLRFPLYKTNCTSCYQYHYTSRCDPCDVRLCTTCRPPPSCKKQCPLGHDFLYSPHGSSVICDLCGISLSMMGLSGVYGDRGCNFDICSACHNKLPEEHPQPNYKDQKVVTEVIKDKQHYFPYREFLEGAGFRRPLVVPPPPAQDLLLEEENSSEKQQEKNEETEEHDLQS